MSDLERELVEIDEPVRLCKHVTTRKHTIWEPKWSTRQVLILCAKTGDHNLITFTKTNNWQGVFYVSGKTARKYKKVSNGTSMCYPIPLDDLQPFELLKTCGHELW